MKLADWQIISLPETSSTNDVAQRLAQDAPSASVIRAERQLSGRGRLGRAWQSLEGNLFFSILLKFPLKNLGALVLISALSILQAIKKLNPSADVLLKWPNDVLLDGAKVSGILLEKAVDDYMIVGIGINVAQSPQENMGYAVTSLRQANINVSADEFFDLYLLYFTNNVNILENDGLSDLRAQWLANAKGIGEDIVVRLPTQQFYGIFRGIDENANLLLEENGEMRKVLAGDVFYVK